jgi:hypothetical protein
MTAMQFALRHIAGTRSRAGTMLGLAAAAGAFAAAATTSTSATARADDFTVIIDDIQADVVDGQSAFATAAAGFGGGDVPGGLAAFLDGVDDDFVAVPYNLDIGTLDALSNQPVAASLPFNGLGAPTSFADAVLDAEQSVISGRSDFSEAATLLSQGDYAGAGELDALGSIFTIDVPVDQLLVGAVEAIGL